MEDEPNRPDTPNMPEEDQNSSNDQGQQQSSSSYPFSSRSIRRFLKPGGVSKGPLPTAGVPNPVPSIPGVGGPAGTVVQGASKAGGIIGYFSTPVPGWLTIAIIIVILLILLFWYLILQKQDSNVTVTLTKSGPAAVKNPVTPEDDPANEFEYTLNVAYTGNPSSITVTDYLPEGVEYVEGSASASGGMYNPTTHTVTWNLAGGGGGGSTGATGPSNLDTFNQSYFSGLGFPTPQDGAKTLSAEGLKRWDEGAGAAVLKASSIVGIDPGIVGAWSFFEGINYDMKVDNCQDSEYDLNTPCNSSNWQVGGPGVRPAEQLGVLAQAFEKMYGSSDASTVQKVGQSVYSKIGRSGTFPSKSASEIASSFSSNPDLAGDLMRDYSIGAYILATIFKEMGNGVADTMEGWSPTYYNRQDYINTIKALYDAR